MTFQALYRLERRGLLDCPILGVAGDDWTIDQLREHARKCIADTGESIDDEIFDRFAARLSYVSGDFGDDSTYERVGSALSGARSPVFYLEIPPSLFGMVIEGLARVGVTRVSARGGGEAVRARRRPRPVLSTKRSTSTWTSPSSTGSTTSWATRGSTRSGTSGSRTRCSSRSGIATTSRPCSSRWPRPSGWTIAAISTIPSGRSATWW